MKINKNGKIFTIKVNKEINSFKKGGLRRTYQGGGIFDTAYLNPENWGVNNYTNSGTFNAAFKKARQNGEKEFIWSGKKYTTELMSEEADKQFQDQEKFFNKTISEAIPKTLLTKQDSIIVEKDNKGDYSKVLKEKEKNNPYDVNKKAPYKSITTQQSKDSDIAGYYSSSSTKNSPAHRVYADNTRPTNYLHELGHAYEKRFNTDEEYSKKINNNRKQIQGEEDSYQSKVTEMRSRVLETLYFAEKKGFYKRGDPITKEVFDKVYTAPNSYDTIQNLTKWYKDKDAFSTDMLNLLNTEKLSEVKGASKEKVLSIDEQKIEDFKSYDNLSTRLKDASKMLDLTNSNLKSRQSEVVVAIKQALVMNGYNLSAKTKSQNGEFTSILDEETKKALIDYQKKNNLPLSKFKKGGTFDKEQEQGLRGWMDRNDRKGWIDCISKGPCGGDKAGTKRLYRPTLADYPGKSELNKLKKKKVMGKATSWNKNSGTTNKDKERVDGIADILSRINNISNRKVIAKKMIQDFKEEDIKFDKKEFLSMSNIELESDKAIEQFKYGGKLEENYINTYSIDGQEAKFFGNINGSSEVKFNRISMIASRYDEIVSNINKVIKEESSKPLTNLKTGKPQTNQTYNLAVAFKLITQTGIRIGNEDSAEGFMTSYKTKGKEVLAHTYGLSTLLPKHVEFKNGIAYLDFTGKKHVENTFVLSKELSKLIKPIYDSGFPTLFNIDEYTLTQFIKNKTSPYFSSKDFRTFRANVYANKAALTVARPKTKKEYSDAINVVADYVSNKLNNTPGVVKKSYIDSLLFWFYFGQKDDLPSKLPEEGKVEKKEQGGTLRAYKITDKFSGGGIPVTFNSTTYAILRKLQDGGELDNFNKWRQTIPDNLRYGDDETYDLKGWWESMGKPETWEQAVKENNLVRQSDGDYHGNSRNPSTGQSLKKLGHDTLKYHLDNDAKEGYLTYSDDKGNFYTLNDEEFNNHPLKDKLMRTTLLNEVEVLSKNNGGLINKKYLPRKYKSKMRKYQDGGKVITDFDAAYDYLLTDDGKWKTRKKGDKEFIKDISTNKEAVDKLNLHINNILKEEVKSEGKPLTFKGHNNMSKCIINGKTEEQCAAGMKGYFKESNNLTDEDLSNIGFGGNAWDYGRNLTVYGGEDIANTTIDKSLSEAKTDKERYDIITKASLKDYSGVKVGDVISMTWGDSPNKLSDHIKDNIKLWKDGDIDQPNTHVGYVTEKEGKLYVDHNVHGRWRSDPIEKVFNENRSGSNVLIPLRVTRPDYEKITDPSVTDGIATEYNKLEDKTGKALHLAKKKVEGFYDEKVKEAGEAIDNLKKTLGFKHGGKFNNYKRIYNTTVLKKGGILNQGSKDMLFVLDDKNTKQKHTLDGWEIIESKRPKQDNTKSTAGYLKRIQPKKEFKQVGENLYIQPMYKNGGTIPDRYKEMGFTKVNTPKKTPNASKSHAVLIKDKGKYRLIRFGQQGVTGAPKKEGESESYRNRRKSFKARHAKNIAKGKTSAAYWADKVKW